MLTLKETLRKGSMFEGWIFYLAYILLYSARVTKMNHLVNLQQLYEIIWVCKRWKYEILHIYFIHEVDAH